MGIFRCEIDIFWALIPLDQIIEVIATFFLRQRRQTNYAAWNTLNNASFLYAKDADLVFFDIAPLKYTGGWREYRDTFKKNVAPGFSSLVLTPHNDVKVTRRGNMALTTLTFHLSAKQKDGTALDFDARHSIVWEKRGGQWLIIHEHVSKPLF